APPRCRKAHKILKSSAKSCLHSSARRRLTSRNIVFTLQYFRLTEKRERMISSATVIIENFWIRSSRRRSRLAIQLHQMPSGNFYPTIRFWTNEPNQTTKLITCGHSAGLMTGGRLKTQSLPRGSQHSTLL